MTRAETGDDPESRRRFFEPSTTYLAHTLEVADTRLLIEEASRRGEFDLVSVETEPTTWRTYLAGAGNTEILKPDLAVVTANADWEEHWFIEVDRGTESIPVLLLKCRQYERYRQTGREQAERGVFPRVLWVLPHPRRRAQLGAAVAEDGHLSGPLFRIVGSAEITKVVAPDTAITDAISVSRGHHGDRVEADSAL